MKWQRLAFTFCFVLLMAGWAGAENTVQDFTAEFFEFDPGTPGLVTVILENESGEIITPYVDFEIPGFEAYIGRPQFSARTGGANATQEVGSITSVYTAGGADTTVLYDVEEDPLSGGNGVFTPTLDANREGFITLTEDGNEGATSAVAWDLEFSNPYDSVVHSFPFSISGVGDPVNDQADGISWGYLNVDNYEEFGVTGAISENPSNAGSLGVGFDIWDNCDPCPAQGGNSITIYNNGQELARVPIDPGTTDPNTGEPWSFNSFETDEIIQATISVTAGTAAEEPDPPVLVGGTPFEFDQAGAAPAPQVINEGPGPGVQPGYLQLSTTIQSQSNSVAFDQTSETADEIVANFKIQLDGAADGMSFLILDADFYADSGPLGQGIGEEPNLSGVLGIGFDIYDNEEEGDETQVSPFDPEGCGGTGTCANARANHVSLHFGSELEPATRFDRDDIDLASGDWHDVTVTATQDEDGMLVSVVLVDGSDGSEHVAFDNVLVDFAEFPSGARAGFGARTGGSTAKQNVDDLNILWTPGDATVGDYNLNGELDAGDLDLQAVAIAEGQDPLEFDLTGDGAVNGDDRIFWLHDLKSTWVGDADLNGLFDSGDFVAVFIEGLYETGEAAGWAQGDWNADLVFDSGDFVAAFIDGGYEIGAFPGAVQAVPEPSSLVLALLSLAGLVGLARRRG